MRMDGLRAMKPESLFPGMRSTTLTKIVSFRLQMLGLQGP